MTTAQTQTPKTPIEEIVAKKIDYIYIDITGLDNYINL